jgi:hypothetical protein
MTVSSYGLFSIIMDYVTANVRNIITLYRFKLIAYWLTKYEDNPLRLVVNKVNGGIGMGVETKQNGYNTEIGRLVQDNGEILISTYGRNEQKFKSAHTLENLQLTYLRSILTILTLT